MLHTSKPFLLIDASRIATEIRKAPISAAAKSVTMDRPLPEIEDELDELEKAANLTLDAISALRHLAKSRKLDYAMMRDNCEIAQSLADIRQHHGDMS